VNWEQSLNRWANTLQKRKMRIFLKDFKHTVLLLDSKELAAPYRKNMDVEKVVIVYIINKRITKIRDIQTADELQKALEDDSPMSFIAPMFNEAIETTKEMLK